jgi:hypothetical protein
VAVGCDKVPGPNFVAKRSSSVLGNFNDIFNSDSGNTTRIRDVIEPLTERNPFVGLVRELAGFDFFNVEISSFHLLRRPALIKLNYCIYILRGQWFQTRISRHNGLHRYRLSRVSFMFPRLSNLQVLRQAEQFPKASSVPRRFVTPQARSSTS